MSVCANLYLPREIWFFNIYALLFEVSTGRGQRKGVVPGYPEYGDFPLRGGYSGTGRLHAGPEPVRKMQASAGNPPPVPPPRERGKNDGFPKYWGDS